MRSSSLLFIALALIALVPCVVQGFYLPGIAPKEFKGGVTPVPLKVNKLVSSYTQLPYDYYSLAHCAPDPIVASAENLGELLLGDKIENSLYDITALVSVDCRVLCEKELSVEELNLFEERIKEFYHVNWIIDNIPAAMKRQIPQPGTDKTETTYLAGFPLGIVSKGDAYLHNHVDMTIYYHVPAGPAAEAGVRIVRFVVEPTSKLHSKWSGKPDEYPETCLGPQEWISVSGATAPKNVTWTYSVEWKRDPDIKWSTRWDVYLKMQDAQIHWFSIVNSLMIVFFLTGMVAMILLRTLNSDIKKYREMETPEEIQEETGWKLVHGDVFRPPAYPMLLSMFTGNGVHINVMLVICLVFALLGFLSPANRGGLLTAIVVLFVLMSIFSGYFSARVYKVTKGANWKQNTIMTSMMFTGYCFCVFFVLNILLAYKGSTGHVSFGILLGLFLLWVAVSVPLSFFGSYLGFKKPVPEAPVRTNQIPRQVPEQVWYMTPLVSVLMGGILPFGAVFIELFFILTSIWQHQFYYVFGFLFIVYVILVITCAEITIVMCYFQLCSEDYHWWWRSFLTAGASAFYFALYSVFYFFTKLHISGVVSSLIYFGYSSIMVFAFFVLTGTIGFFSCHWFVFKIYGAIKIN